MALVLPRFVIIGVVLVLTVLPVQILAFHSPPPNLLNAVVVPPLTVVAVVPPFAFQTVCVVMLHFLVLIAVNSGLPHVVDHLVKCQNAVHMHVFAMMNSRVVLCLFGILPVGLVVTLVLFCRLTTVLTSPEHFGFVLPLLPSRLSQRDSYRYS